MGYIGVKPAGISSASQVDVTGDLTVDTNTLYVDAANNRVGISTASPTAPLHLNTSASGDIAILNTSANSGTGLFINSQTANQIDVVGYDGGAANAVNIRSGGASGAGLNVTTANKIGIGTNSPSQKFVVSSSGADNIVMCENSGASIQMFMQAGGSGGTVGTLTNHQLQLLTNNTARMTIGDSGVVYIGGSTTRAKVNVERNDASSYNYASISVSNQPDHFVFYTDSTVTGSITRSGGTGVNYNTSSDHRLKENAVDMTGAIARVKSLQPKRFNFIADDSVTVDGFMAHEAQTVVPEAVTGTHNEVDADGNAVMQGIDQSKLVPLLTGALQEAIAKIETLETQRADLEARLTALETP